MDKKQASAVKAAGLRDEIHQFAKQIREKVYGAKGHPEWGTLFSEIEELGVQVGDAVCREFVQQGAAEQAAKAEEHCPDQSCPTCKGPLEPRDPEPKTVLTRRGEVGWNEPQSFCKKCRKAFFPSVQKFGHAGKRQLQP